MEQDPCRIFGRTQNLTVNRTFARTGHWPSNSFQRLQQPCEIGWENISKARVRTEDWVELPAQHYKFRSWWTILPLESAPSWRGGEGRRLGRARSGVRREFTRPFRKSPGSECRSRLDGDLPIGRREETGPHQYFQRGRVCSAKLKGSAAPGLTSTRTQPTRGEPGTWSRVKFSKRRSVVRRSRG